LCELVGESFAEEHFREAFIAGGKRQAGMAVIAFLDRDDLATLRGAPCRLDGDVDGFAAAAGEDAVLQISGSQARQRFTELGAGEAREVMVANVERLERTVQRRQDLRLRCPRLKTPPFKW
jgi:hypothetical protein